jgi:hypothetical protein
MGLSEWLIANWFDAVQTIAIAAGFLNTAFVLRRDAKMRRMANTFELNRQHRDLWRHFADHPELQAILEARPLKRAPSIQEAGFVNLVIQHLQLVHRATKDKLYTPPEKIGTDIKSFFSRPIPRRVWEELKGFQPDDFVRFVEQQLNN